MFAWRTLACVFYIVADSVRAFFSVVDSVGDRNALARKDASHWQRLFVLSDFKTIFRNGVKKSRVQREQNNHNGKKGRHKKHTQWINKNEPNACDFALLFFISVNMPKSDYLCLHRYPFFCPSHLSHRIRRALYPIPFSTKITCSKTELKTNKELRQIARWLRDHYCYEFNVWVYWNAHERKGDFCEIAMAKKVQQQHKKNRTA